MRHRTQQCHDSGRIHKGYVAVHCRVLQCIAVCYSALVLQCVAVCCSVLQRMRGIVCELRVLLILGGFVAGCCNVLQCAFEGAWLLQVLFILGVCAVLQSVCEVACLLRVRWILVFCKLDLVLFPVASVFSYHCDAPKHMTIHTYIYIYIHM